MSKHRYYIKKQVRHDCYRRDGYVCAYCGKDLANAGEVLTLDHITTRAYAVRKGLKIDNGATNLITACLSCNSARADIPLEKYVDRATAAKIRCQVYWRLDGSLAPTVRGR